MAQLNVSDEAHIVDLVDSYVERIKGYIANQASDPDRAPVLDLSEVCMDRLADSSALGHPGWVHIDLAKAYSFQCQIQRAPLTTMALARAGCSHEDDSMQMSELRVLRIHMEMKMERLMTEIFRDFRNQRLIQGS